MKKLSGQQLDIYLDQIKHPSMPMFNIGGCVKVEAPLDVKTFKIACESISELMDIFKLKISLDKDDIPYLIQSSGSGSTLTFVDFSDQPLQQAENAADQWVGSFNTTLFDYLGGRLIRLGLAKISEREYWFIPVAHHLIADGWSFSLLIKGVFEVYQNLTHGLPVTLSFPAYWDAHESREQQADKKSYLRSKRYWLKKFSSLPEPLMAPKHLKEHLSETTAATPSDRVQKPIGDDLYRRFIALTNQYQISILHFFMGLLFSYFSRTEGKNDLIVGTPIHNRKNPREKLTPGLYVSMMPVRISIERDMPFIELVKHIANGQKKDYRHQKYPIGDLCRDLRLSEQGRSKLFELSFNYQKLDFQLPGFEQTGRTYYLTHGYEQTPFTLTLCEYGSQQAAQLQLDYNLAYFSEQEALWLLSRFEHLAQQVLANPQAKISSLSLACHAELKWLNEKNNTSHPFPSDALIQELFAHNLSRHEQLSAVRYGKTTLSYKEFDHNTNQVAHFIRSCDIQANDIVAICMNRSIEMVVAIWATLKAGAAYLPLDPTYPEQRLRYIMEESQAKLLLTQKHLKPLLAHLVCPLEALDEPASQSKWGSQSAGPLPKPASFNSDMLAYVIYTSGSTGMPKGVMISHRALINRILWMQDAYPLSVQDTVLQKTPYSFDVSVWEFVWPLLYGACLVVAKPEGHKDPEYIANLIRDESVTTLHFVPSMLNAMLSSVNWGKLSSVRQVFCSGETLAPELAHAFYKTGTQAKLHNLYGPTEAAIDVSYYACQPDDRTVPIGRPIYNIQLHVLDRQMQICPVGVAGELYIAGVGLARGYLNRQDLTEASLIECEILGQAQRLYKSGDLARWSSQGQLEYLGRLDHQVKIRGLRIELGEIDSRILAHYQVKEAAVVARQDPNGAQKIVAYSSSRSALARNWEDDLTSWVLQELPEYMVPNVWVALPTLPLNSNGKVDKKQLPEPSWPTASTGYQAPSTEIEMQLAEHWQHVLGLTRVGITDNFFSIGGDSILAIKLVSALKSEGIQLSVGDIFKYPTIKSLATAQLVHVVDRLEVDPPFAMLNQAERDSISAFDCEDAYPLTSLQSGMVFQSTLNDSTSVYHDIFSCELSVKWDQSLFEQALRQLVRRHEMLRCRFSLNGETPLQLIQTAVEPPLSIIKAQQPFDTKAFFEQQKSQGFRFTDSLLYRVYIHLLGGNKVRFSLSFHHAILDGWSVAQLTTELWQTYHRLAANQPFEHRIQVPPYREFVALEQAAIGSEAACHYWRSALATTIAAQLPESISQPTGSVSNAVYWHDSFAGRSSQLLDLARQLGQPVHYLLLAIHFRVLSLLTGHSGLASCVVQNGRPEQTGAEQALGLYLNSVPLPVHTDTHSWRELIDQIRNTVNTSLAYRRCPLADIQRDNGTEYSDILFNYIHFHVYKALNEIPDFKLEAVDFFEATSFKLLIQFVRDIDDNHIRLQCIYDNSLLDEPTLQRYCGYYVAAADALLADIETAPHAARLMSQTELERLLWTYNQTDKDYPANRTVVDAWLECTRNRTRLPAISFADATLSFEQFAQRVHGLAGYLVKSGIQPGDAVGICLDRGIDMVAAIWAIMRIGAAYVPLEPSYPEERLQFMLEDTQAPLILTCQRFSHALATTKATIISLDTTATDTAIRDAAAQGFTLAVPSPDTTAYIIYTSGSTGRPKGVMVSHAALYNRIEWMQRTYRLSETDVVLQKTPFSFDVSVWEFIWPLTAGAKLTVAEPEGHKEPQYLADIIQQQQVTTLHFVPSMLSVMLTGTDFARLRSIRQVFCSGEALPPALCERFFATGTGARLHNLYGPTEAAIDVSFYECDPDSKTIPIGQPIDNIRLYILDQQLNPVPIGVSGELHIAGIGLAKGYLNRDELTREKFIVHSVRGTPERLYKTGDICRWRGDGQVEYLGRGDDQVKIRGLRIELGEIEKVLSTHQAVKQNMVLVREERHQKRLVAYLRIATDASFETVVKELKADSAKALPDFMIPSYFVQTQEFPVTSNGKIDKKALLTRPLPRKNVKHHAPSNQLEEKVVALWKKQLELDHVMLDDHFADIGGSSIDLMQLAQALQQTFATNLRLVELFEHSTPKAMATLIADKLGRGDNSSRTKALSPGSRPSSVKDPIAVIGMAGRYPQAQNLEQFWDLLSTGKEAVMRFNPQELMDDGLASSLAENPDYVAARATLSGTFEFDAEFFGYPPHEAEIMDPQLRILHQVIWHSLENAGYHPGRLNDMVGLYGGASNNLLWQRYLQRLYGDALFSDYEITTLSDREFFMTRVAHSLNLTGPAVTIQTACSTSLVALHHAVRGLQNGDCNLAIAAGASVQPRKWGYLYQEGMIGSPNGKCSPFSNQANGTLPGEGVGAVVLKRLPDAEQAGDSILAVVKGSAINNDGHEKTGYTAPSVQGQVAVIKKALSTATVSGDSITYVEAHGTATPLGDPIEIEALTQAFSSANTGFCSIGSLKGNIGHLDAAAGITGFIKTVLALKYQQIPPSINYRGPNPHIDFNQTPFRVNTQRQPWRTKDEALRRAGVSSFGIGGTNAHVIIEEYPVVEVPAPASSKPAYTLSWSAHSTEALGRLAEQLIEQLQQGVPLPKLSYSLHTGGQAMVHQAFVTARTVDQAIASLQNPHKWKMASSGNHTRPVYFLFSGQGTQHLGMYGEIYEHVPRFAQHLERLAAIAAPWLPIDPLAVYTHSISELSIDRTDLAQPLLFIAQLALAQTLLESGVKPTAMLGHSLGEYVAACIAGVFNERDALNLVCQRGRLMQGAVPGSMLSVNAPAQALSAYLNSGIEMAAENAPEQTVLAGTREAVASLSETLRKNNISYRQLHTSHAYHSRSMELIMTPLQSAVKEFVMHEPVYPYLSNITGDWVTPEQVCDDRYWANQLRAPVQFNKACQVLTKEADAVFIEFGPGNVLTSLVKQHTTADRHHVMCTLVSGEKGVSGAKGVATQYQEFLEGLTKLSAHGIFNDWALIYPTAPGRVSLPAYPFKTTTFNAALRHDSPDQTVPSGQHSQEPERTAKPPGQLHSRPQLSAPYIAATTELQRQLVDAWQQAFKLTQIGVYDNFFELGGNSLMASSMVAHLRTTHAADLTVAQFLEAQCIAELERVIEFARGGGLSSRIDANEYEEGIL